MQDSDRRRSPHLLPYIYVDEAIKIANRYRSEFVQKRTKNYSLGFRYRKEILSKFSCFLDIVNILNISLFITVVLVESSIRGFPSPTYALTV